MRNTTAAFLGVGIHSSLGNGIEANLAGLRVPPALPTQLHNTVTHEPINTPYKLLAQAPLENITERSYKVVLDVIEQAFSDAQLTDEQRQKVGLFIGSSSFDIPITEAKYQQDLGHNDQALALQDPSIANFADHLIETLNLQGEDYSYSTACTSSANALIAASAHVEAGLIDHALVVGIELHNNITALGFHSLDLLTSSVMKPFDQQRDGIVLGESVSALILGPPKNKQKPFFYLRGSASLSDTFSITATKPDGSMIYKVITDALSDSQVSPDDIHAIKVHGTASLQNDEAEAAGMHLAFAPLPKLCAVKPYIGHCLGSCGLTELILFFRAAEAGFLIATPGIGVKSGELKVQLNQHYKTVPTGNFMLNYFGFGGNNTSLIISNISPGTQP